MSAPDKRRECDKQDATASTCSDGGRATYHVPGFRVARGTTKGGGPDLKLCAEHARDWMRGANRHLSVKGYAR